MYLLPLIIMFASAAIAFGKPTFGLSDENAATLHQASVDLFVGAILVLLVI